MISLPSPLRWLWEGWKRLSHAIGIAMSFIVLTVLWIVAFGLYALVMKCGKLFRRNSPSATYWRDVDPDYPESLSHGF